ncbi:helix-turn-helix domain-containing protein [Streptomyces sp. NPDC002324]
MTEREEPLATYAVVLTTAEVAEILRVSPVHVARQAERGTLRAFRVGTSRRAAWRFDRRRIAAVMEGRSCDEELPPLLDQFPEVLTAGEVGDLLRYDQATIAQMAAKGLLPGAFKTSTSPRAPWRFRTQAITDLIEGSPPTAAGPDTPAT